MKMMTRKTAVTALVLMIFAVCAHAGSAWAQDRVMVVGGEKKLVIVGDGALLGKAIEKCTGVKPTVVPEKGYTAKEGEYPVYVGDGAAAREALGAACGTLDAEGYIIKVEPARAFVFANKPVLDTGNPGVWGQVDFARKFLKADAYFPGELGAVFPKQEKVELTTGTWVEEPGFLSRQWSGLGGVPVGWRVRASGGGGRFKFHHNFWVVLPPAKYKGHPEYYPVIYDAQSPELKTPVYGDLKPGERFVPGDKLRAYWQPCTSNPEVLQITIDAALEAIAKTPANPAFSLGINDSQGFCHCPECVKDTPAGVSPYSREANARRMYGFYDKVAKAVRAKAPGATLGFLAYQDLNDWKPQRLGDGLLPYITVSTADSWDETYKTRLEGVFESWAKTTGRFGVYEWLYGDGFVVPRIYMRDLTEGLKKIHALGGRGFYAEAYPNWGLDGPKLWVLERVLWNPKLDADALTQEWCDGLFGEAGPAMRAYFDRLERAWREQKPSDAKRGGYRLWGVNHKARQVTEIFPVPVCEEAWALLGKAREATQDPAVLARIDYFQSSFALTRLVSKRYASAQAGAAVKPGLATREPTALAAGVKAYSDWAAAGHMPEVLADIAKKAPGAFQCQVTPGQSVEALAQWDTDFPVQVELSQAIVDEAAKRLSGVASAAGLKAKIGEVVNELTADAGAREVLIRQARAMVLAATQTAMPMDLRGPIDERWGEPAFSGAFYVYPRLGVPDTNKTTFWLRYDNDAMYLAARCEQPQETFGSKDIGRDNVAKKADTGAVSLDDYQRKFNYSYPDPAAGITKVNAIGISLPRYTFGIVTAEGSIFDAFSQSTGYSTSWDGVEAVTEKTAQGWEVKVRIARSPVGIYPGKKGSVVPGFNVFRVVGNQKTAWVPGVPGWWALEPRYTGCVVFE